MRLGECARAVGERVGEEVTGGAPLTRQQRRKLERQARKLRRSVGAPEPEHDVPAEVAFLSELIRDALDADLPGSYTTSAAASERAEALSYADIQKAMDELNKLPALPVAWIIDERMRDGIRKWASSAMSNPIPGFGGVPCHFFDTFNGLMDRLADYGDRSVVVFFGDGRTIHADAWKIRELLVKGALTHDFKVEQTGEVSQ